MRARRGRQGWRSEARRSWEPFELPHGTYDIQTKRRFEAVASDAHLSMTEPSWADDAVADTLPIARMRGQVGRGAFCYFCQCQPAPIDSETRLGGLGAVCSLLTRCRRFDHRQDRPPDCRRQVRPGIDNAPQVGVDRPARSIWRRGCAGFCAALIGNGFFSRCLRGVFDPCAGHSWLTRVYGNLRDPAYACETAELSVYQGSGGVTFDESRTAWPQVRFRLGDWAHT